MSIFAKSDKSCGKTGNRRSFQIYTAGATYEELLQRQMFDPPPEDPGYKQTPDSDPSGIPQPEDCHQHSLIDVTTL